MDEWRTLRAAVEAGVGAIQVREKDLGGRALEQRVSALTELAKSHGAKVLVNDRADVARVAGAPGVHLPEAGLSASAARAVLGSEALVGRSIHRLEQAEATADLDYLVFGPIFDTPSKRQYGRPQGLDKLRMVAELSSLPVVAIGGITPQRVESVLRHGARGVAVMGAILSASEPAGIVREYRRALLGN